MGGGCALPNPAAFYAMQAGFQEPRTRDKGVCKWGGLPPPPTTAITTLAATFFYWTLSERALLIAGESETSRRAVSQRRPLVADLPTSSEKEKRSLS